MPDIRDTDRARETFQVAQIPNAYVDIAVTAVVATADLATVGSGVLPGRWVSFRAITAQVDICGGTQAGLTAGGGIPVTTSEVTKEFLVSLDDAELLSHISTTNATLRIFYR